MSKLPLVFSVILVMLAVATTIVWVANFQFNQMVTKEVKAFFAGAKKENDIIQKEDLEGLPSCVQKWLAYSGVVGKEHISTVRLQQKATLRTRKESPWMPTEAEQYFTVDKPGFIWKAKIKAAPFIHLVGRDKYHRGKGNMFIKFLSLITVADARGKEIDQGTLLRYLAETVWFPTAALSDYITWEEVDAESARATMSFEGVTASGIFRFNEKGEVLDFTAKRYMESKGEYSLETWFVSMKYYKEFNGIKIPAKGEVIWKLETGDFSWYHFEITEIQYNKPLVY